MKRHIALAFAMSFFEFGSASPSLQLVRQNNLHGHTSLVTSSVYSNDSRNILSCDTTGEVRFWDAATGTLKWTLTHKSATCTAMAFSTDDEIIFVAGRGFLAAIDPQLGEWIKVYQEGSNVDYSALSISPDSNQMALGAKNGGIYLAYTATGAIEHFAYHDWGIQDISYMDDTGLLLVGDATTIKVWDIEQQLEVQRLIDTSTGSVPGVFWMTALAFSDDYAHAIASSGNAAVIFNLATGSVIQRLSGHTDDVLAVTLLRNTSEYSSNLMAITSGRDHKVAFWDVENGVELASSVAFDLSIVSTIAVSPNYKQFSMAAGKFNLFGGYFAPSLTTWRLVPIVF